MSPPNEERHTYGSSRRPGEQWEWRKPLGQTWQRSTTGRRAAVFSGVPLDAKTVWLVVNTRSSQTGYVDFMLEGSRQGIPFVRYFQLGPQGTLALNVDGAYNATLYVVGNTISGDFSVEAAATETPRTTQDPAVGLYPETVTAGATYAVPSGAVGVIIGAVPPASWDWVLGDGAGGTITVPGPALPGATAEVQGTQYTVGAGANPTVVWQIAV